MHESIKDLVEQRGNPLGILLAVILGVAFIGLAVGLGAPGLDRAPLRAASVADPLMEGAPPARSYRDMRKAKDDAGENWRLAYAQLQAQSPGLLDPVDLAGLDKNIDLAARARRRAYDGAPPTIPHPIRQQAVGECLACHAEGLRLRGLLAVPISHDRHDNCTQCHVQAESGVPRIGLPASPPYQDNRFVGQPSPTQGARAWDPAPPVIPHTTLMRERCMSCHGLNGRNALRTPHPDRQSCEQCHAVTAVLEQRVGTP